jgi:hypothetical protein
MENVVKKELYRIIAETNKNICAVPVTPLKQLVGYAAYDGKGYSKEYIRDFNTLSDVEIEKMYAMDESRKKR